MKKKIYILAFLIFPLTASAQFEQKVSINLSAGMFKTFGDKWSEYHPKQMPNYKAGIASELGFQYNINRRFSILAEFGIMYSGGWSLISKEGYNPMHYEVWSDTVTVVSEGFNELNLSNFSISIKPELYLLPGKKFNPFIYTGININYTRANYTDNQWIDFVNHGLNNPDDTPYNPFLKKNIGFGLNPGLGIEYSPSDKISISLTSGYCFIFMNEKNFQYDEPDRIENFNAFLLQAGIRYSFFKSKDL